MSSPPVEPFETTVDAAPVVCEPLGPVSADCHHEAFESCAPPTLYGRYRHDGEWYLCRIRSRGPLGDHTVVWEDGTTQEDTPLEDLRRPDAALSERIEALLAEKAMDPSCKQARLEQLRESYCRSLPITQSRLCDAPSDEHGALFASSAKPTLYGQYRHTGGWCLCRVRSVDVDGTCTVVWEDGFLQAGTKKEELRIPSEELAEKIEAEVDCFGPGMQNCESKAETKAISSVESRDHVVPTYNGMTAWEAAKKGDVATALTLIDRGDASPNDVEVVGKDIAGSKLQGRGRTPLHWACWFGHVELVRELLARGGKDADGSTYLAVSNNEKACDIRDKSDGEITSQDDSALIRAMLVAARSSSRVDERSIRSRLPRRLYRSAEASSSKGECVVCLHNKADAIPVPCGHIACCMACLKAVRKSREGCPVCRSRIVAIVPQNVH